MIEFTHDQEDNQLVLEQKPPYVDTKAYNTSVCIQPDPCPGCGDCRLCYSECTCRSLKSEG